MATTTTNVINGLKYLYGANKVAFLFNQESPTYNMLSKVKKGLGGRGQFIIPLLTKNAGAWKGIAEGGALPTALAPATAEATFALHEFTGMVDTTWKLIQDSPRTSLRSRLSCRCSAIPSGVEFFAT
jgi:HK97 family phage major capsid protein